MRKLMITSAFILLAACSGAPSKGDVREFVEGHKPTGSTVTVNDLRCTEQENEEFNCFVDYTTNLPNGKATNEQAEDARFRKAKGEWESTILGVSHFTATQPD